MSKPYSGKRIKQHSQKLADIKRREKRLRKIGLSVISFPWTGDYVAYVQTRNEFANKKRVEQ